MLCRFAEDTRRALEQSRTSFGQLIATHIGRQLDLVASERYGAWFRTEAPATPFNQAIVFAAIAGSDVTRPSLACPVARSHFGLTADHVRAIAAVEPLRYGRNFAAFGALEDLYMHAEAGRHYTHTALLRRGSGIPGGDRAARAASDAIIGHDSFNAGFGQHRLKPLLATVHGGSPEDYDYPAAATPNGLIVQVLDRLDGSDADTMLRYVTEGVSDRHEPLSAAIKTGVIDNAAFLIENQARLYVDARAVMDDAALRHFLTFPGLHDLSDKLDRLTRLTRLLNLTTKPSGDGFYHLLLGTRQVCLDSLDAVRAHLSSALDLIAQADHTK